MTKKKHHISEIVNEIANYIYAHPDKKIVSVVSVFVGKYNKNQRTIERYIQQAKEYNAARLSAQQEAQNVQIQQAAAQMRDCIMSREDVLKRLKDIAMSEKSESNAIRAIDLIAKIEGYHAPAKTAVTDSAGNDIPEKQISSAEEARKLIEELESMF